MTTASSAPTVRTYQRSKGRMLLEESEDALAFSRPRGLYAVADGATTAPYSGQWARLLVRSFVRKPPPAFNQGAVQEWLQRPRRLWGRQIPWSRLDYFARRNAERGSFSTLVGFRLEIRNPSGRPTGDLEGIRWQSLAVGDSCLFHLRNGRVLRAFPLSDPESFDRSPYLLATTPTMDCRLRDHLRVAWGMARPGDVLALCTDALARYVVENTPLGEDLVSRLLCGSRPASRSVFREFVERERTVGSMRNDDVALLLVALD